MKLGLELIEQSKVKQSEILSFNCEKYSRHQCRFHVTAEALIVIYHHFAVPRKFITAEVVDDYAHIYVPVRGCIFSGLVKVSDAAQFLNSTQKQLPAPRAKRVAGREQKCLSFSGSEP
jgi:hypothetical protein